MAWEPTHVQFTVLRARKLVGKLKGSKAAKISDTFVTIQLGKEKFQTSTIKYGSTSIGVVEWFEECDLMIPHMSSEVEVTVMNRGLLSDEFIGYVAVPLSRFSVYDRPKSQWFQLMQKPSKEPDGRYRGEVEARLTFHVKEQSATSSNLKSRAPSLKSLVSAVGKVSDKFKRSKSLRGDGRQTFASSTPSPSSKKKDESHARSELNFKEYLQRSVSSNMSNPAVAGDDSSVHFPAADLYAPDWNDDFDTGSLEEDSNFMRSYSLTTDRRRRERDFKSQSMYNLPSDKSMTLPSTRRKNRPSLDESYLFNSRSRISVTSQEGYLENIFHKECEVYNDMSEKYEEGIAEEPEETHRRAAQPYKESKESITSTSSSYSTISRSESESETEMRKRRPQVRLKKKDNDIHEDEVDGVKTQYNGDDKRPKSSEHSGSSSADSDDEDEEEDAEDHKERKQELKESNTLVTHRNTPLQTAECNGRLNSQGSSDNGPSSRGSSIRSSYSPDGKYHSRGSSDTFKKLISPDTEFSFTPTPLTSGEYKMPFPRRKSVQSYAKGGRRFTVQGMEGHVRRSAPDIRSLRSYNSRDESIPEDLMAVYKNMNREELIRLVVTHKAQLIRKDQYINDLERYIDDLLVRVMEGSPRLLQSLQFAKQ